jgi:hypothetical protein
MCRIVHHPQATESALQSRCIDTKNQAVPLHCTPRFKRVRVSARISNAKSAFTSLLEVLLPDLQRDAAMALRSSGGRIDPEIRLALTLRILCGWVLPGLDDAVRHKLIVEVITLGGSNSMQFNYSICLWQLLQRSPSQLSYALYYFKSLRPSPLIQARAAPFISRQISHSIHCFSRMSAFICNQLQNHGSS